MQYIYWIPKMHKNPYKLWFIAGASKCSIFIKPLFILLTKLLTHIKAVSNVMSTSKIEKVPRDIRRA